MKKIEHVAIDLGYGYVKGISSTGKRILFPTLVGSGFERQFGTMFSASDKKENNLSDMHVKFNEQDYFVGELAKESRTTSRIFEQERYDHEYSKVLMNVAIQLLTEGKSSEVNVSTGLPLSYYKAQARDFRESLLGVQPIVEWKSGELVGESLRVNINDAVVFPQGASAIYSALLNSDGKYIYPHLMEEGTLIALIDIGYRTTDYVVVQIQKNGSFVPMLSLSGSIDVGVSHFDKELERHYSERTGGSDLNEFNKSRILKQGHITYKGNKMDFTDLIEKSKDTVAMNVADSLKSEWGDDSNNFDAIFLAGGGGNDFSEYIQRHFDNRLELITESQFANTIGYFRYGNSYFNKSNN